MRLLITAYNRFQVDTYKEYNFWLVTVWMLFEFINTIKMKGMQIIPTFSPREIHKNREHKVFFPATFYSNTSALMLEGLEKVGSNIYFIGKRI